MTTQEDKRAELRQAALEYHEFPTPGKIAVTPTKQLINQRDLALAYSPGVSMTGVHKLKKLPVRRVGEAATRWATIRRWPLANST